MSKSIRKIIRILVLSMVCLGISIALSLSFGSRRVAFGDVIQIFLQGDKDSFLALVVRERIPRTVFGLVAGAATSAALSSLVSAIMLPNSNVMNDFRFWQVGSISGASWSGIRTVAPFLIIGIVLAMALTPALNTMMLGDETATGLGVNTTRTRGLGALAGVLLCGATTALTGPIGFVGLMVPHAVRILFGGDIRGLIPLSAVGGAVLLVVSDVIGRVLGSPGELEVGVVTAFLGAPVFIFIARRAKVRAL